MGLKKLFIDRQAAAGGHSNVGEGAAPTMAYCGQAHSKTASAESVLVAWKNSGMRHVLAKPLEENRQYR